MKKIDTEKTKVYAKQIPPEYQESPLNYEDFPEYVICDGNKQFRSRMTAEYETLKNHLTAAVDDYVEFKKGEIDWYNEVSDIVSDYFTTSDKNSYSEEEMNKWESLLDEYATCSEAREEDLLLMGLGLMTGKEYQRCTICGCCQGDWQHVYYPTEYGPDFIKVFESEYFDLGSEWIIHDENNEPETADDVAGYVVYCHDDYAIAEVKKELSEIAGCEPDDLVLFTFKGWTQIANYETV